MGVKLNVVMESAQLSIDNILLDPLNPRFIMQNKNYKISDFKDKEVQGELLKMFKASKEFELNELMESICEVGFCPLERIAVVRLEEGSNYFVVIEGNRRIAAIRYLLMDETLDLELKKCLETIDVCIIRGKNYEQSQEERTKIAALSHLSGKVDWGDYQKAVLLNRLIKIEGMSCKDAGAKVGLGRNRAIHMFEAYNTYESIQRSNWYQQNEELGYRDEDYFPFFYEVMKDGDLQKNYFKVAGYHTTNKVILEKFCVWIGLTDHRKTTDRQIKSKEQIKDLKIILNDPSAREALENGASFNEAFQLVHQDGINHSKVILGFLNYLKKVPKNYLEILSKKDKVNLNKIGRELGKILNNKFE